METRYNENSIEAIIRVLLSLINIDGLVHENEIILKNELFNKFNILSNNPKSENEIQEIEERFYLDFKILKKDERSKFYTNNLSMITDKYLSGTLLISLISLAKSDNDYHHLEKEFIHNASNMWEKLE